MRMIFRWLIDEQLSTYQINKRLNESNPSIETKQKVLRLVMKRIVFVEDQITIKHVISVSDVRLRRNQLIAENLTSVDTSG
jgi:hypothetical protein